MAESKMASGWEKLYEQVAKEVAAWRRQHPRATMTEIEGVIDEHMNRLRAKMLADTAGAADPTVEAKPICPHCGRPAQLRGKKKRRLQTQGGEEMELEREHAICPFCGMAFFPPG